MSFRVRTESEEPFKSNPHLIYQNDRKKQLSFGYYKQTRVNSCSFVKMEKGNNPKAIPYYKKLQFFNNAEKSSYDTSLSRESYKIRHQMHVGSPMKMLDVYRPTALRSRLDLNEFPMIYNNQSFIDLQDGLSNNTKKHFETVARSSYGIFTKPGFSTNPAIISMQTKFHRRRNQE